MLLLLNLVSKKENMMLCLDSIYLSQDGETSQAVVSMVMNIRILDNAWNFLNRCETVFLGRRATL